MVLKLRREILRPLFRTRLLSASVLLAGSAGLRICWRFEQHAELYLVANLSNARLSDVPWPEGSVIFAQGAVADESTHTVQLDAWGVACCLSWAGSE